MTLEDRLQELVEALAADHNAIGGWFDDVHQVVSPGNYDDSFTIGLDDMGTVIDLGSVTPVTITIPTYSSVAFPIGAHMEICQVDVGQVTVAPVSGAVTLRSRGSAFKLNGIWAYAYLRNFDTNIWVLTGDLTT